MGLPDMRSVSLGDLWALVMVDGCVCFLAWMAWLTAMVSSGCTQALRPTLPLFSSIVAFYSICIILDPLSHCHLVFTF